MTCWNLESTRMRSDSGSCKAAGYMKILSQIDEHSCSGVIKHNGFSVYPVLAFFLVNFRCVTLDKSCYQALVAENTALVAKI